jgi:hypothetical protein
MRRFMAVVAGFLVPLVGCGDLTRADFDDYSPPPLRFTADPGYRVVTGSVPRAVTASNGTIYLSYWDDVLKKRRVVSSVDGLVFGGAQDISPQNRTNDPQRVRMPNGTWRVFNLDGIGQNPEAPSSGNRITSGSSSDGISFFPDAGARFSAAPLDNGQVGVFDVFTDTRGGVVLLYVGDLRGINNVRRAYSTDNGLTFQFQDVNPLGDYGAARNQTFVDPFTLRLPDGRIRLFVMRNNEILSFISFDDGGKFNRVPGVALRTDDFTELRSWTLNDPTVVRLPDGRYRMYVASHVEVSPGVREWRIVSATANP